MIHYRQCLIYEKAMLQKFISQCLETQDAFSPNYKVINGDLVARHFLWVETSLTSNVAE